MKYKDVKLYINGKDKMKYKDVKLYVDGKEADEIPSDNEWHKFKVEIG